MKNLMNFEFSTFFQESSQINLEAFQDQKNSILAQKTMIKKNGAKHLPHLCMWTGLRLISGVPALVHNFDPLTQ